MSFDFKQFSVTDTRCAMKVGTDAVLLGAWAQMAPDSASALDIGAGSGILSLIIAQRYPHVAVTAVEIDSEASADCDFNFNASPWKERLNVVCRDFSEHPGTYDLIISNPPFFTGDLNSASYARTKARQGDTLNYFTLIDYASRHLSDKGILAFVSDCRREKDIIFHAELRGLKLTRQCFVCPTPGANPKRILWRFATKELTLPKTEKLYIRDSDDFSQEYVDLSRDLYL